MRLVDWATIVGGFGTGIAVLVAMAAIIPALMQVTHGRRLSREAGALQAHREFIKLCFDHPQFSSTDLFKKSHPNVDIVGIGDVLTADSERYLWFLSIMLNSCEQILNYVSSEGPWCEVVEAQLSFHAEALHSVWDEWESHYGVQMRQLVNAALKLTRHS